MRHLPNEDWFEFDTNFYNLIQKHFKYGLNEDENLFNWYCKLRNKIEKQIVKQQKGK